jgi:rod shape determining protein RodA
LPVAISFLKPYQKSRILTFLNPERDPLGAGYQIIQSKIAIGSEDYLAKVFKWLSKLSRLFTRKTY